MLLKGECRLGIHSAKDLPFPLPSGLAVICLTKGIDSSDSLVLRPGETLEGLPKGAVIATSSVRREQTVLQLRQDLSFIDLRGTIGQRLAKLDQGEADGVVVAEAALIRLGLTHLNRIRLPGETVEGQGQLAIVARAEDEEMSSLFACMDVRQASVVK
jgi:hydroxymethylbilane synthase